MSMPKTFTMRKFFNVMRRLFNVITMAMVDKAFGLHLGQTIVGIANIGS